MLRVAIPLEPMSETTVLPFAIDRGRHALFLDFDGTLVEIAERPDAVRLEPEARAALAFLAHEMAGAVAIVTGREIADIDYHLSPLSLPVAGVHGLTRRSFDGAVADVTLSSAFVPALEQALRPFVERNAGVLVERKRGAVALHYRLRPELEGQAIGEMVRASQGLSGITLMRGKMVIEAKSSATHKGHAIEAYLNEAPFKGRVPVVAGDDRTDEDAFITVNRLGGVSIKIGDDASAASLRVPNAAAFRSWLMAQAVNAEIQHARSSGPTSYPS
jgi:trehalose 6-phosphate phosphatase